MWKFSLHAQVILYAVVCEPDIVIRRDYLGAEDFIWVWAGGSGNSMEETVQ